MMQNNDFLMFFTVAISMISPLGENEYYLKILNHREITFNVYDPVTGITRITMDDHGKRSRECI